MPHPSLWLFLVFSSPQQLSFKQQALYQDEAFTVARKVPLRDLVKLGVVCGPGGDIVLFEPDQSSGPGTTLGSHILLKPC